MCGMSSSTASSVFSSPPHPHPCTPAHLPTEAQVLNALEHRYDNPSSIPARELSKLIYGADSVFAREATPESVRAAPAVHAVGAVVEQWQVVRWQVPCSQQTATSWLHHHPQHLSQQCLMCPASPCRSRGSALRMCGPSFPPGSAQTPPCWALWETLSPGRCGKAPPPASDSAGR